MKRVMFLAVLAALLISTFVAPAAVLADGDDNLKKAGQQALAEREEVLFSTLRSIETYVQIAADDRMVTKDEMIALRDKVRDFKKNKTRFDWELKDYGLQTSTDLAASYKATLHTYFVSNMLFKEDIHGGVRRFFASMTGLDVTVGRGAVFDALNVWMIALIAIFFLLMTICFYVAVKKRMDGFGEAAVMWGLFCVVLFIILVAI